MSGGENEEGQIQSGVHAEAKASGGASARGGHRCISRTLCETFGAGVDERRLEAKARARRVARARQSRGAPCAFPESSGLEPEPRDSEWQAHVQSGGDLEEIRVWRLVGGVFFGILRPIERLPHTAAHHAAPRQLNPASAKINGAR